MSKATKLHEMLAAHHQFAATEHTKACESLGKDAPGYAFHEAMTEHHAGMAEQHMAECEEAKKTATGDVAKVSVVAPTLPQHLRAVPRHGQQFDKATIPPEFARFVTTVAEEE
jgi:hypothetical protein